MFGLFRRRPAVAMAPQRARPALEWLEGRDCPAPMVMFNTVGQGVGHNFNVAGSVMDDVPVAGLTVTFGGVASGTTTIDSSGHFFATLSASALGTLTAQVTDSQGLTASGAAQLLDSPPQINNFAAVEVEGDIWTFSGQVAAPYAVQGLTVSFSGTPVSMQGRTATVNADGTFSLTVRLDGLPNDNGTVLAQVTDWWGYASNQPGYYVSQS
jgi:hypothetical protein